MAFTFRAMRSIVLLGAISSLLIGAAPASAAGVEGPKRGRPVMLVANAEGGTVSIVDARSFKVLRSIDVISDGNPLDDPQVATVVAIAGPNYAQDQDLSRDGRTLFVSRGHRGDVAAFDVATGRLLWKQEIPGFRSDHMAISPDGKRLAVSALSENVVLFLDPGDGHEIGRAPTGQWPHDNHYSVDGRRLYNGSIGNILTPAESRGAMSPPPYQLTIIDTATMTVTKSFTFDAGIRPFVLTHDERRMFAQLSEYSGLVEIDPATGRVVRRVDLPVDQGVGEEDYDFEAPHHGLAISADEQTLCAAGRISDYAALISTKTMRPTAFVDLGDAPGWAATDPLGNYCFVTNTRDDTLSAISYSKRREVARLAVGDGPKQLEAARIPEDVLCSSRSVPGCSREMRVTASCQSGGRVRLDLRGDLDAVTDVRFSARGRSAGTDAAPPYRRTLTARTTRALRGARVQARIRTTGAPLVRTVRMPAC
jgi:DNA-binding beta-propeller fold protein YncE